MRGGFQKVPIRGLRGVFIISLEAFVFWSSIKVNRSNGRIGGPFGTVVFFG